MTAPRSWWAMAIGLGVAMAIVVYPFGPLAMLAGLAGGAALAMAAVSSYGSARIRVVAGSLVAGKARVPLSALGEPVVLDRDEALAWRSHKADPRAFMLLRSYVPTALKVTVTDPADPTPYLYLSTRAPQRLADALVAARAASGRTGGTGAAGSGTGTGDGVTDQGAAG
ncbi:DUF3093 domain-containing protein [Actinacidiphila acididurans]|uniref:DUF3093 domain-containing protein n=1 Tax=Actinacidiphila acididurans TaxID=2784346 RepID=UPI0022460456|nr:DUF3093 domain-containing protein [Actinacidiphila acididurans]